MTKNLCYFNLHETEFLQENIHCLINTNILLDLLKKIDNLKELPEGIPEQLWIDNYPALEKYLDEEDALPNGIIFKLVDGDEILEESIDLREFLRKYIFTNNILL